MLVGKLTQGTNVSKTSINISEDKLPSDKDTAVMVGSVELGRDCRGGRAVRRHVVVDEGRCGLNRCRAVCISCCCSRGGLSGR